MQSNFVAGKWVTSEATTTNLNPATGKPFAKVSMANVDDVNIAVQAAQDVHLSRTLIDMPPHERGAMLLRISGALEELKNKGARILSQENGKRLTDAESEFDEAIRYFQYYSGMADKLEGRSIPLGKGYIDYTVYMPYGVTAHIVPWNFPFSIAARSLAPALATANTAIVKLPELAPMAGLLLGKACEMAGVPEGAVSVLCGSGSVIGQALTKHPDVQQVVFTGSVPVGQAILRTLSERIVPAVTELGGKSAAIVTEGADLDRLLESVFWGIYFNADQVCSIMSRLIISRSMQNRIVNRISQKIDTFSIGDGMENYDVTPLISEAQVKNVLACIDKGIAEGATLVTGGHRLNC